MFKYLMILVVVGQFYGCGRKKAEGGGGGRPVGKVEAAFIQAAGKYGVPVRMLIATAHLESHLSPELSSALYVDTANQDGREARGFTLAQTAFGITRHTLGLNENPDADSLVTQIDAYAAWLSEAVTDIELEANPQTAEAKFQWIREITKLHRDEQHQRRNVRVIFSRQMIAILNQGFIWQDPNTAEILTLEKESPPLEFTDFPLEYQRLLNLSTDPAEIPRARYFPLTRVGERSGNQPKGIRVIHCPFSLSACLELQNPKSEEDQVRLGAHYVVPQDLSADLVDRVLQIRNHSAIVTVTNAKGDHEEITEEIVILLTGHSGRYVNGVRYYANPTWFTVSQLKAMGNIINDVCTLLAEQSQVEAARCMSFDSEHGVKFVHQGPSYTYRWGDIPDFDNTIFKGYIVEPDGLSGETVFEFKGDIREYTAGSPIDLTLRFELDVRLVILQRLVRCNANEQRLVWWTEKTAYPRSSSKEVLRSELWDPGPNGNGEQYFRALVYGEDSRLLGWAIDRVHLKNFNMDDVHPLAPQACM